MYAPHFGRHEHPGKVRHDLLCLALKDSDLPCCRYELLQRLPCCVFRPEGAERSQNRIHGRTRIIEAEPDPGRSLLAIRKVLRHLPGLRSDAAAHPRNAFKCPHRLSEKGADGCIASFLQPLELELAHSLVESIERGLGKGSACLLAAVCLYGSLDRTSICLGSPSFSCPDEEGLRIPGKAAGTCSLLFREAAYAILVSNRSRSQDGESRDDFGKGILRILFGMVPVRPVGLIHSLARRRKTCSIPAPKEALQLMAGCTGLRLAVLIEEEPCQILPDSGDMRLQR